MESTNKSSHSRACSCYHLGAQRDEGEVPEPGRGLDGVNLREAVT